MRFEVVRCEDEGRLRMFDNQGKEVAEKITASLSLV